MAQKIPMVMGADGHPQQLQSTDQLQASMALSNTRLQKSAESSAAAPIGTPVYITAAGFLRAQANAKATATIAGLVYDPAGIAAGATGNFITGGIVTATTAQWDAVVTGESGGLVAGSDYFLDPANLGKLTATPPTTSGQCNTFIGTALSTTDLEVTIRKPILL